MARFIPDIKTQRWIVISPVRWGRPDENFDVNKSDACPFCTGNESMTPSEIMRIGDGEKDKPGWKIRVIPNKYPITDIHEVIIHSPEHEMNLEQLPVEHVKSLMMVYRTRFNNYKDSGQVMIFCNQGEHAGASLRHPHSQIVVIPRQINLDALVREPVLNVVNDNNFFITYCPDFSQWPYEVWIAPKKVGTIFGDLSDEEVADLASIMKNTVCRLRKVYEKPTTKKFHVSTPFAYNFYIHHAKNWFIRIIPRLIHRAGFELGTGLSVNVVDPTDAASELSKVEISGPDHKCQ